MKIVFTGIAGTRKAELAEKLAQYIASKRFNTKHPPNLKEDYIKRYIQFHDIEKNIGISFPLIFLNSPNELWKSQAWSTAINQALEEMTPPPEHTFISIHNYYLRNGKVFSCVDWSALRRFKPDVFVTLIDDIFDSWQRIENYEKEKEQTRSHFELDELLLWRTLEIAATAHLAQNLSEPPIPHYIISVKHSLETFWQILFDPEKRPLVYGCCPITNTRNIHEFREEINNYHIELSSHFREINPLTIDELRTTKKEDWLTLPDDFSSFEKKRWPLPQKFPLGPPAVEPTPLTENPFKDLSNDRLLTLKSKIDSEIVNRDFSLVSQAQALVVYRPFFPESTTSGAIKKAKSFSSGMSEEVTFALELKKDVYLFHPACDCDPSQENFFRDKGSHAQIHYFPSPKKRKELPEDDLSGFSELIDNLKKHFLNS